MDLKDIVELKEKLLQQKKLTDNQNKEIINGLIGKNNKLTTELDKSENEIANLTRMTKL
jgi:hypothetical protein